MKSPYFFIIKPKGDKHLSEKDFGDYSLTVNDNIDDHKYTNRIGEVVETPVGYGGIIEKGDFIVVHHNTFRDYRTQTGEYVQSQNHIKNDLFYTETPFMVIKPSRKETIGGAVFLERQESHNEIKEGLDENVGVVAYNNKAQEEIGLSVGSKVLYKNGMNYEFDLFDKKLIKINVDDIVAKL